MRKKSSVADISTTEALEYLTGIRVLCQRVFTLTADDSEDHKDEDSDDDDSEAMDDDQGADEDFAADPRERCLRDCKRMLNHPGTVSKLVAAAERADSQDQGDAMLLALCSICHNLLLSSKQAVHTYRLLNTLAFSPLLLHRLWNLTISAKQEMSISKPSLLLTVGTVWYCAQ